MSDYEKLKKLYDQIDSLLLEGVTSNDASFITWWKQTDRCLIKIYGENSQETESFRKRRFSSLLIILGKDDVAEEKSSCSKALLHTKAELKVYLDELEEAESKTTSVMRDKQVENNNSVFIVHGHCNLLKESVARLVEKQGLRAIILHERRNKGASIIEKFESNSEVGAAICLFTADDYGRAKDSAEERLRARQNVVFETGFFMGRLGRNHVIMIADEDVEIPSDLSGVVYTNTDNWRVEVLQELKAIGFKIDLNRAFD